MMLKRKIVACISVVSLSALIITGSFAWTSLNSQKLNEWKGAGNGTENNVGGVLHDDHEDNGSNKDIYVENWGDEELLVRIQLSQYMEIGQGAGLKSAGTDPSTGESIPNPQNLAKSLISGADINNPDTWEIHIPKEGAVNECVSDADFHSYWNWEMGRSQKYYYPVSESNRKIKGYVDQNSPEGLSSDSVNNEGVRAKSTAIVRDVFTMDQWKNEGAQIGPYWVVDYDGWAYWAAPVKPGETTGLLLTGVTQKRQPSQNYYYGINVIAQMATKYDEMKSEIENNFKRFGDVENGGWTLDGQTLMARLAEAKLYSFSLVCEAGGRIPSGTVYFINREYEAGAEIKIDAFALNGYIFDIWVASDERGTFDNAYIPEATFTMPDCNVAVTATFKRKDI